MQDDESNDVLPRQESDLEGVRSLKVGTLNYTANSLTEIRKIAETNPELAEKIVDSQYKVARWYHVSELVGISVAAAVAIVIILGFVQIVVWLGWWQSLAFIAVMLGLSHVLRTLLTGEWSDTSWFGRLLGRGGSQASDKN